MANKMERFSADARRVLSYAQDEADYLQRSHIGTEHILVGLIREEDGIAGRVLRALGADKQQVQSLVEKLTGSITPRMTTTPPELSPGVKRVLELAVDEARRLESESIDTEHLMLGLLRLTEGIALDILKRLRVNPNEVRQRVLQEISRKNDKSASP